MPPKSPEGGLGKHFNYFSNSQIHIDFKSPPSGDLGGRIKLSTIVENVFTNTAANERNCMYNKKV